GVTIRTNGTDVAGQSGNITVNAAIEKTAGSDASLSLEADGNITINQNITSTLGKLNINLLGAGSFTSRVQVLNSKLATLGGNITIDQLNHTVTNAAGNPVANPNAMTANINNNSILDTSGADNSAAKGDITINGYNPNIDLGTGAFWSTVRNANTLIQIGGGSQLTGNNIRLFGQQNGKNAQQFPVFVNNANLNADGNISLTGLVTNSSQANQIELRGSNTLTAGGNITIENNLTDAGTSTGVYLNGSGSTLTVLTAGENIHLIGSAGSGTGVNVNNATLNAAEINILGVAKNSGTGFSLSGIVSNTSIDKLGLSSAGSGATVTNALDNSLIGTDASKAAALLQKHIENQTSIDMNGTVIFDDTSASEKGWTQDYSSDDMPYGGWIFNRTQVISGGDVILKGVGFINSTLSTSAGKIELQNTGDTNLTQSNLTATGDINVSSAMNLTLNNVTINSGGDINLRAAGSGTAMLKVQSSNLTTTNGGNISLDQQDPQVSAPDGTITTNANAMTVDVQQSTLNAGDGDILINGYNPNICLSSASYVNTIRNGGIMVGVRNGSNLTGNNISLNMQLNGPNAAYLPVFINGANITAKNDINIGSVVSDDATPVQIEIRGSGNTLTAQNGNITLTNSINSSNPAVLLSGSGSNTAITLNALNGSIILNGSSATGTGVSVANATLNAQRADIHGQSTGSNTSANGFSITNTTLGRGLTDLTNVTLSSAGSAAGATNILDSSVVNDANRNTLLGKSIDNMTVVEMNGTAIFNDGTQAWDQKYQTDAHPNAGWIFNNTTVNASGADLSGVGFTNSSLNMTTGDLIISNNGSVMLTNSIINALQGAVKANANGGGITLGAGNITAKGDINLQANNAILMQGANLTSSVGGVTANTTFGNIDLTSGNISANKDINLHTLNGTLTLKGNNASSVSTIKSTAGDINVTASNLNSGWVTGIWVTNTSMLAGSGNISINGTTPGVYSGVRLLNSNITANSINGTIDIYGKSAGTDDGYGEKGSVYFSANNNFTAKNINITGKNTHEVYAGAGMSFDAGSRTSFYGNANVLGYGESNGITYRNSIVLDFYGGKASISGYSTGKGGGDSSYVSSGILAVAIYAIPVLNINLNNTDINLLADVSSTLGYKVQAFNLNAKFNGRGNVSVSGIATDGDALSTRMFSNTDLVGNVSLSGKSDSGTGVLFQGNQANGNLINASITGFSNTGAGVVIDTSNKNSVVNLNSNTIVGASNTSGGISINGYNVNITNGSLNGTSNGTGAGITLTGGTNYTLSGANVSGQSANGSGIAVSGNLSVNDNV
ncbi:hypothetical protein I3F86_004626, partial [Salmonella enterica]|nr:hypothetical protein [Salmonella enterica]